MLVGNHKSERSILGPLLFNFYMRPLAHILQTNKVSYHYVDDTQIYIVISPSDYSPIESLNKCIEHINDSMCHNFLQSNKDKTEIIVFGAKEDQMSLVSLNHFH